MLNSALWHIGKYMFHTVIFHRESPIYGTFGRFISFKGGHLPVRGKIGVPKSTPIVYYLIVKSKTEYMPPAPLFVNTKQYSPG